MFTTNRPSLGGKGKGGGGLGENPGENGTGSVREADKERAGSRIP